MTTDSDRLLPDPRQFGDGAHPWLKLGSTQLHSALRDACAQQHDAGIAAVLQSAPSPAAYASAVKLWTSLGDRKQAASLQSDARKLFAVRKNSR